MNKIAVIAHNINDSVVEQRNSDGYINATALSKAYKLATGKRRDVSEWLSNKRTFIDFGAFKFKNGNSRN